MTYREKKRFKIKEIEEISNQKVIKAINKEGIGDLKIIAPQETDLEEGTELDVIIKEVKDE